MLARLKLVALVLVLVGSAAGAAWGQDPSWPEYPIATRHSLERGPGFYLSWWKLGVLWLGLVVWVKTADWVNRDSQILRLPHAIWNSVVFFPFLAVFLLTFLLPNIWIGLPLLVLAVAIPAGSYVWRRNAEVGDAEKVLTPSHLRYLMAVGLQKIGIKVSVEPRAAHERGAPVTFVAQGGANPGADQANLITARQSDGFVPAKDLIADAVHRRCDKLMLDYGRESVAVRYEIDGVWHEVDPLDRESGDSILLVFMKLANLDVKERRKRQDGAFTAQYEGKKYPIKLFSQGTKTGQRVILDFGRAEQGFESIADLGMRDKMQERLREMLARDQGIFLFSAVPAGGLSTTVKLALKLTDRYMRDFVSFQASDAPEPLPENIELATYDPAKDDVEQRLTSVMRREPNAVIIHQLPNARIVEIACEQAQRNKLILATIPAKEAVEALLRVLLLKVPARQFAPAVFGVLNQRLVRRLCEKCKEGYTPSPDLLKKLGIPAGRVDQFYRPPTPGEDEVVCEACGGIGYYGRIAVYELLSVDAQLQKLLIEQPKLELLRKAARSAGHLSLQDEGVAMVAKGITSLAELQRVLKQ